ncbi:hypothetical protein BVRB_5g106700 [Beta vulgaris subsp. vulgaris]|nr:hypothetical protein BVRB_5g106700 [Beta vulgaris subsp. vulgaris]
MEGNRTWFLPCGKDIGGATRRVSPDKEAATTRLKVSGWFVEGGSCRCNRMLGGWAGGGRWGELRCYFSVEVASLKSGWTAEGSRGGVVVVLGSLPKTEKGGKNGGVRKICL